MDAKRRQGLTPFPPNNDGRNPCPYFPRCEGFLPPPASHPDPDALSGPETRSKIPPHDSAFFIPAMTTTGYDNTAVFLYDGTRLFATSNDAPGLADSGDSVNLNDIAQGSLGDC